MLIEEFNSLRIQLGMALCRFKPISDQARCDKSWLKHVLRVVLNVAITCWILQRMHICFHRFASYTRRLHLGLIRRIVWWGSTMRMLNSFH